MDARILEASSKDVSFTSTDSSLHTFEKPHLALQEPTATSIREAVELLKNDQVVAFPTETVYGLGANALSNEAVSKIYEAKNRPPDNPLILHIASLASLRSLLDPGTEIPSIYKPLIAQFWPGPLTILLPLDSNVSGISSLCTSGQSTFAVRMPQHPLALALLNEVGVPLAAPSANTSTRPSPTTAQHVYHDLSSKISFILDGGPCGVGVESTVVDGLVSPPQVLRPGGVSIERIRNIPGWEDTVIHRPGVKSDAEVPRTPGMKYRHYSPSARVWLFESTAKAPTLATLATHDIANSKLAVCRTRTWPDDLARTLGDHVIDMNLGQSGGDIAKRLFAMLRSLDDQGIDVILVEGISEEDEGLAVMNRLRKAATVVVN